MIGLRDRSSPRLRRDVHGATFGWPLAFLGVWVQKTPAIDVANRDAMYIVYDLIAFGKALFFLCNSHSDGARVGQSLCVSHRRR
jgi:hypothetical protein